MRILLDTCTFIWAATERGALSARAAALLIDPANEVYLSSVSAWEVAVKFARRQLQLSTDPAQFVAENRERHRFEALAFDEAAAVTASRLPSLHRDPFDRMLVCQAIVGGMTLVTPDRKIRQYPVLTDW